MKSTAATFIAIIALLFQCNADAQDDEATLKLLKQFREEFIEIVPGEEPYKAKFEMIEQASSTLPEDRKSFEIEMKDSFAIAKYEVTQELWQAVMGSNPSRWTGNRNSVENLSYGEAVEFCRKVTALLRKEDLIDESQVCRLPTEVEWEYVARAGTTTKWSFGDDRDSLDDYAWSTHNAAGNDPPVGALKPNPWGLYDIHGYLWEWCVGMPEPKEPLITLKGDDWFKAAQSEKRVLRGGSWKDPATQLQSGYRRIVDSSLRDDAVGLRCVISN